MRSYLLLAVAFAAGASARVIEARQRPGRPTATRPQDPAGTGDLGQCGLDSFEGHPNEANRFCSSILVTGTVTVTTTISKGQTSTIQTTIYTTVTGTPKPTTTPTTTPKPPTTTPTTKPTPTTSPTPSPTAGCGLVGYTKDTAAYYFDSSGTKNTFAACSAACKADSQCKSFGYGEANCMLFNVAASSNVNYNPQSPYTFYDVACPTELPVRKNAEKRQISISLGISDPAKISSACLCYLGPEPVGTTRTASVTTTGVVTVTSTVTRTLSLVDGRRVG